MMSATIARKTAMTILLLTAALALNVPAAEAWTVARSGCTGGAQVPTTNGGTRGGLGPLIEFPTRYVWRSTCAGNQTQIVTATYKLYRWDSRTGQWPLYLSATRSVSTNPGSQGGWLGGYTPGVTATSYYSVEVVLQWRTSAGGFLGSEFIDYNATRDYACYDSGCSVYASSAVGAFIRLQY